MAHDSKARTLASRMHGNLVALATLFTVLFAIQLLNPISIAIAAPVDADVEGTGQHEPAVKIQKRQLVRTVLRPRPTRLNVIVASPKKSTTRPPVKTTPRKKTTKRITTAVPVPPPPPPPPINGAVLQYPPAATRAPSNSWSVSLGGYGKVPNNVDPWSNFYHVTPDCFLVSLCMICYCY